MMKFFAVVSALVASVAAQGAFIFAPDAGDTLTAGSDFLATITKPVCLHFLVSNSNTHSLVFETELALAVNGGRHCDHPAPMQRHLRHLRKRPR